MKLVSAREVIFDSDTVNVGKLDFSWNATKLLHEQNDIKEGAHGVVDRVERIQFSHRSIPQQQSANQQFRRGENVCF